METQHSSELAGDLAGRGPGGAGLQPGLEPGHTQCPMGTGGGNWTPLRDDPRALQCGNLLLTRAGHKTQGPQKRLRKVMTFFSC